MLLRIYLYFIYRWNFVDDTGALFCGEPRCVLMQTDTKTAEEKYFKKTENEIPVLDQAQSGSENYESSLFCDPGYFIVSLQKLPSPSERDVKPGPVEVSYLLADLTEVNVSILVNDWYWRCISWGNNGSYTSALGAESALMHSRL